MKYQKVQIIAKNNPTGSFAAGCQQMPSTSVGNAIEFNKNIGGLLPKFRLQAKYPCELCL